MAPHGVNSTMPSSTSSTTRRILRLGLLPAVAIAASMIPVSTAQAGTYDVWSCQAPDGSPAPVVDAGGGWVARTDSPNYGVNMSNACAEGGALTVDHGVIFPQVVPTYSTWRFTAPAGTGIVRYVVEIDGMVRGTRAGEGAAQGNISIRHDGQFNSTHWTLFHNGGDVDHVFPRQEIVSSAPAVAWLEAIADCTGVVGETCSVATDYGVARLRVFRSAVTLDDRTAPVVTSVSGDAVTGPTWAGPTGISIVATDQGGGVLRVGVEVDGQIRAWIPVADAPCRIWPGTDRAFVSPKPCPGSVGLTLAIPVNDLPEGVHTVRVLVEDAAGNQATAFGPATKTLSADQGPHDPGAAGGSGSGAPGAAGTDGQGLTGQNGFARGAPNGAPAAPDAQLRVAWDGHESSLRSIKFNQRPVLEGQLTTPNGEPIRGAAIRVASTREARNATQIEHRALMTDGKGSFRWRLPKGVSSRTVKVSYHQYVGDAVPVAKRSLRLRVTAALRFALNRSRARRGQRIRLSGVLRGKPVPSMGKVIELQARNPGRKWITFKTVRTKTSGRFASSYRFRKPGPAIFEMRARARKSGDYAYATGSSPRKRITVR